MRPRRPRIPPPLLLALCLALLPAPAAAGGYRIPENSWRSLALAGALYTLGESPDGAYFNPASMTRLPPGLLAESGLLEVRIRPVTFSGTSGGAAAGAESRNGGATIPWFHAVFPSSRPRLRAGISLVAPAGLATHWDTPVQRALAQTTRLVTAELNPSVAWRLDGRTSVGAGIRLLKARGVIKADHPLGLYAVEIDGDGIDTGVNLALERRLSRRCDLALAWRSRIDMGLSGFGRGFVAPPLAPAVTPFDVKGSTALPLPEVAAVALGWDAGRDRFELAIERVGWSDYRALDIELAHPAAEAAFGAPRPKAWRDVTVTRLGFRRRLDRRDSLYLGFVHDPSPVPDSTLGFDLPDADARAVSVGFRRTLPGGGEFGLAWMEDWKSARALAPGANAGGLVGRFGGYRIRLVDIGYRRRF